MSLNRSRGDLRNRFETPDPFQSEVWAATRHQDRLPWWREPPFGFILTIPLVVLGFSIPYFFKQFNIPNPFLDTPLVLVTLIIALIWGTEPAVLAIILSAMGYATYFAPQPGSVIVDWYTTLQFAPFVLAEIVMVAIAATRERGRRQVEFIQKELEDYADKLNQLNQELVEANYELKRANQFKDQFLSIASHELKTPITTIRGHAQLGLRRLAMLHDLPPDLELLNTTLDRIDQQTFRLNSLVDDLLDLSILRSGVMTMHMAPCDLGVLCTEAIAEQRSLTGRGITLELPPLPVTLQADAERLAQVMTNVVSNAVKYSPEGSVVQVQVSRSYHTALIQVRNQGPVIPQEQLANIFEPFYRAPAARTSSKKGWGLGLAISKQIVEQHKGRIWAESSPAGTVFSIELPLS